MPFALCTPSHKRSSIWWLLIYVFFLTFGTSVDISNGTEAAPNQSNLLGKSMGLLFIFVFVVQIVAVA